MLNLAQKDKSEIREELNADIQIFLQKGAIEIVPPQRSPKYPQRMFRSQNYGVWNAMRG